jgi:hypothetical protein
VQKRFNFQAISAGARYIIMARDCILIGQVLFHGLIWTSAYLLVGIMMAVPLVYRALELFFT